MPSKTQLGMAKGITPWTQVLTQEVAKGPIHSLLVTTSAYHTSLCLLITLAGLS